MKKDKHLHYPAYDEYYVQILGKQNTKRLRQKKLAFPGFEQCLQMMRSKDAFIWEDGFHFLAERAAEYVDELLAAFQTEEDGKMRSALLELLGYTKSPRAFPIFLEYVQSQDDSLRRWAKWGMKELATTKEGRQLLWEAHFSDAYRNL